MKEELQDNKEIKSDLKRLKDDLVVLQILACAEREMSSKEIAGQAQKEKELQLTRWYKAIAFLSGKGLISSLRLTAWNSTVRYVITDAGRKALERCLKSLGRER